MSRCTAESRKAKRRCKAQALPGHRVCVSHLPSDHPLKIADLKRRLDAYRAWQQRAKLEAVATH